MYKGSLESLGKSCETPSRCVKQEKQKNCKCTHINIVTLVGYLATVLTYLKINYNNNTCNHQNDNEVAE